MDTQFAVQFPIVKALQRPDGTMEFEALASDDGLDIERETVAASGWEDSLKYLKQKGRVGWYHRKINIGGVSHSIPLGDIEEARVVSNVWARDHFGDVLRTAPIGKSIYLRGYLYKPNEEMHPDQMAALKLARGTLDGQGTLGVSLEGTRVKSAPIQTADGHILRTSQAVCMTAELTPWPVNPRTIAVSTRIAKSLGAALGTEDEEGAESGTEELNVFVCKGVLTTGMTPGPESSPADAQVIQNCLRDEEEAAQNYDGRRIGLVDPLAREVLARIADEERVHAGELQELLRTLLPEGAARHVGETQEVKDMTEKLTGAQIAKGLREMIQEAREVVVEDPPEELSEAGSKGPEEGGLGLLAKAVVALAELSKAVVKAHTRRLKSGKVVQVREYADRRVPTKPDVSSAVRTIGHYDEKGAFRRWSEEHALQRLSGPHPEPVIVQVEDPADVADEKYHYGNAFEVRRGGDNGPFLVRQHSRPIPPEGRIWREFPTAREAFDHAVKLAHESHASMRKSLSADSGTRLLKALHKALATGDQIVTGGATGGQVLRTQNLDRGVQSTTWSGRKIARQCRKLLKAVKEGNWEKARKHHAKLGSGARFAALEADAKDSGAEDPAAVAAAAGRKKYGKEHMARLAAAARKHTA